MADEARSLKAYGELPENIRVNDTDALNEDGEGGEGDDYIDFDDISGACVRGCCVCGGVVWCGVVWCGVVWCGVVWLTSPPPPPHTHTSRCPASARLGCCRDLKGFHVYLLPPPPQHFGH